MNSIKHLISGGIITNYYCTSKCRHYLYACSPFQEKQYINEHTAEKLILKIKKLSCRSLHIGGGEPLLNIKALIPILDIFQKTNINIDSLELKPDEFYIRA